MISVAICDHELQELNTVKGLLEKYYHKNPQCNFDIKSFHSSLEFLTHITRHGGFALSFIDVFMPGMLGTEIVRELRYTCNTGEIIFLTNSWTILPDEFKLNAFQYLVKPYDENSFFTAIDKAIKRISTDNRDVLTFKTSDGIACIRLRDIIFTETGRKNYQVIHTVEMKPIEVRMTSSELFELLSMNGSFVRCGASMNLNLNYIRQISRDNITLKTGQHISYPYRSYQKLKENFLHFYASGLYNQMACELSDIWFRGQAN